jgi:hypothetical protein
MQGDDCRDDLFDLQDVPTKTLIVMNKIKVIDPLLQFAVCTLTKGEWLSKLSAKETHRFNKIWSRLDLPVPRNSARVLIVKEVKAGQLVHLNAVVQDGVRLASENLDRVTKIDKSLGEVSGVHALASDMRFSAIREIRNAQGAVGVVRT